MVPWNVQFIKNLLVEKRFQEAFNCMPIHKEFVASYVTVTHAKQHGHAINMHAQQKFKYPCFACKTLGRKKVSRSFQLHANS